MLHINSGKEASQFIKGSTIMVDFIVSREIKKWKFSLMVRVTEVPLSYRWLQITPVASPQRVTSLSCLMCFNSPKLFHPFLNIRAYDLSLSKIKKVNLDRNKYFNIF